MRTELILHSACTLHHNMHDFCPSIALDTTSSPASRETGAKKAARRWMQRAERRRVQRTRRRRRQKRQQRRILGGEDSTNGRDCGCDELKTGLGRDSHGTDMGCFERIIRYGWVIFPAIKLLQKCPMFRKKFMSCVERFKGKAIPCGCTQHRS